MRVYAQLKLCFISICIVMNLLFLIHHDNLLLILLLKNYCRNIYRIVLFFFFFQAEDGIRDIGVTGVQTCALPIFVLTLPVVAVVVFSADTGGAADVSAAEGPGWWADLGFTVVCGVVGTVVAGLLRVPVASMLGPMLIAAALDLGGLSEGAAAPYPFPEVAFLLIGLQVGLNFT